MNDEGKQSFEGIRERLDQIVEAVTDEGKTLDEALDLYEEAVKLGMQASSLLEEDIVGPSVQNEQLDEASSEQLQQNQSDDAETRGDSVKITEDESV